ncbi:MULTISPECIES: hypothetical protein [Chromobacterium]|nr:MULTISPECIES: hypothetical protein [Chromobacterium]MBX9295874.1 hypothetical protein [Chromobacterium vaccinii]MBX9346964.1 hypothetical protein [Chromobacterium vaccinii]MBX9356071.1 hypothetical protein [Chromobacterium vaccinii]MCD4505969.1 hypothetical protein [Chromobacterium piscinae]MCD5327235.1 hypothetical protein [Chromobacterium piscinae]
MFRKIVDGALWGLGFWLVGGVLMLIFSSFGNHVEAQKQVSAASAQQREAERQHARYEDLMSRQEKAMARSEQQLTRLDKLLEKWERQK